MLPMAISNATRIFAKNQDEYMQLHVADIPAQDGSVFMTSLWEPTPKELEMLLNGGSIRLSIKSVPNASHPPVLLDVQEAPKVEEI